MLSDKERDNFSDTLKEIEEYPWSVDKITLKGVTYSASEFIKLVIKHKTGVNLSKYLGCRPETISRKVT